MKISGSDNERRGRKREIAESLLGKDFFAIQLFIMEPAT